MADPLEDVLGPAQTAGNAVADPLEDILGPANGPQHGSLLSGMAASAGHAAALHADDYLTPPEWQAKNKRFQKEHPFLAGAGEATGIIGGMAASTLIPGAQATLPARGAVAAGRLAKLADYVLPYGNFWRSAAPGVGWREAAKEGAKGSLKYGAVTRLNDTPPPSPSSGDPTTDMLDNIARRGQKAGDLPSLAWDAAGGAVMAPVGNAVGGYVGNRLAALGQAATLGNLPKRGAILDIKHEIERDSPQGLDATIAAIRDLAYGENRTLGRHGGGAIPQEAERAMAGQFQRLTADKGLSDAQAERVLSRYWGGKATAAERTMRAGSPSEDAWLLSRGGNPFAASTMGGWGRAVGTAYRDRNAIPSNLAELTALATGGEAPALQSTLRKLLNLKSEGGERSSMLRGLRERQKAVGPQMEAVLRRYLGDGDVGQLIAEHTANAQNANALYPQIFQTLKGLGPEAEQRLQDALRPVIESAMKKAGNKGDDISKALAAEAQKFMNPGEAPLALPSMKPLTTKVTEATKDAAGKVIGKTQREVPLTQVDAAGRSTTERFDLGANATFQKPVGDLESILALRRSLADKIDAAYRGGNKNLGHDLKEFQDGINKALRGLGTGQDAFGQTMGKWAAANDTRAYAASLERNYKDALGLNLTAKKGGGLIELERMFKRFRGSDDANKDMIRRGVMGQFKAMLEGKGDLHDAAKIFANPRARQVLTEMIGPEATEEFGGFVARAGLATNTFNMNKGSQTASILDADKEGGWLSNIAGAIWHGNPLRAITHMGEMAGDALKRKKHNDMTGLLSADTANPARLEEVLANIKRAAAPVNQRLQTMAAGARTAGTGVGLALGKRRDE